MKILVTGGLGYIGSHTVVELLNRNYEVLVVDNLSNSKIEVLDKIDKICGKKPDFYEVDLRNKKDLEEVFKNNKIEFVIHFAGLKAVGESVKEPLKYYDNNINGTLVLLELMNKHNVKNIIFSSSATVYGKPEYLPIDEKHPLSTTNPYGATKLFIEEILRDLYKSDNSFNICILRYFNPVGSHESHLLGEDPNGIPNNLVPYVVKVATKKLDKLSIFGDDYDTKDGTGVRDYIHVVDLAIGHVKSLEYMINNKGIITLNLGTGKGSSVLELVKTFEKVNKIKVPYVITERRDGDIGTCYADPSLAEKLLGWKAKKNLEDMLKDAYIFEKGVK